MTMTNIVIGAFENYIIQKEATETQRDLIDQAWRYTLVIEILKEQGRTKGELSALSDMYAKLKKVSEEFDKTLEA